MTSLATRVVQLLRRLARLPQSDIDTRQCVAEMTVQQATPVSQPRFWWLRDGAPEARLTLAINRTTRMIEGSVLRFSRDIRGLEIRTAGFAGGDRGWYGLGSADSVPTGIAFHLGAHALPADDEAIVEIEVRFWWSDDDRHVYFRSTAGAAVASNTLGAPQYP